MKINFPESELKLRNGSKGMLVFDRLRQKYVPLTPEENVRQHFVEYLIHNRHFPAGLMNNEIAVLQNGIKRRCDTVVFDRKGEPLVIVEYKAPSVSLTQDVFDQIYRYNLVLKVRYLIVSNGISTYCCCVDYERNCCDFLREIPVYDEL